MSGHDEASAPVPLAFSPRDFAPQRLDVEGEAWIQSIIGPESSSTIGAGIGTFEDVTFEWTMEYDEVIFLSEGSVSVAHQAGSIEGKAGDLLLVPRGNRVTYHFRGKCRVLFATYPANWEERKDG